MKPRILSSIALVASLLLTGGCRVKARTTQSLTTAAGRTQVWASRVGTPTGDHKLHVTADVPVTVPNSPDGFTVNLPGHVLEIEPGRLLLDKKEVAKIPAKSKQFEATLAGGTLTVSADDVEVLKTTLP